MAPACAVCGATMTPQRGDARLDCPNGHDWIMAAGIRSVGAVVHGVECYEAWRAEQPCPHEAASTVT